VVNAPFRLYWAYNQTIVNEIISKPIPFDRSMFPNQATFNNALLNYGLPQPWPEKRSTFRFTIGRTF
jgi:outer membrane protein insertion porin family